MHYGAVSWRLHEDDFRARSQTIERYGASAIPADSSLVDWPLSYADLEPFYDQAEYELGVSGKAGNLQGKKIDGGNVFEAPRKREYPLPPLIDDQSGALFDDGAKKLGYHPFSSPRAIISQPYNGRPGCTYCGFCQAFGCHVGAKSSHPGDQAAGGGRHRQFQAHHRRHVLPRQQRQQRARPACRIMVPDGSDNTIEAEIVILSPFIYDNTRLLLLSKTEKFPNGLANSSGHLGKHIMAHIMANVFVAFDDRYVNNFMGPSAQKHTIDDFNADNFDHGGLGFIRGAQLSIGTAEPGRRSDRPPDHGDRRPACRAGARPIAISSPSTYARHGAMVAQTENLPYAGPDHRPRSQRARRLGPAGAARHLRLAAAERARARRIRAEEAGRDRPRHGRPAGVARRRSARRRAGRTP